MDLYYSPLAASSRAVLMTAKAIGVDFNKKVIDIVSNEHLSPAFTKINPQQTVPTLVDGNFTLWESQAIQVYLIEKYAKDDALYPKDPKIRALINQRLFFDLGTLHRALGDYYYPQLQNKTPADPELFKKVESALELLNTFLQGQQYLAGDKFTIADIAIVATVSSFEIVNLDISKYSNIIKWYDNCKKVVPGWDENQKSINDLKALLSKA